LLGENGTGKTTLIRVLAGFIKSEAITKAEGAVLPTLNVSYKPQKIAPKFVGTVRQLLQMKISSMFTNSQFISDVMRPLRLEALLDLEVLNLSGGELQRVAITLALGKPADLYLIDEPSAYLDSEQRIVCAKVIKRFVMHARKTALVVEHDFLMATYLADRVIVYSGQPGIHSCASAPQGLLTGMNAFLKELDITFRRDPVNYRPRINKSHSVKDKEQKLAGTYFYLDLDDEKDSETVA
jgi:ATP-binding cassette subfamily E protein 1